MKIMKVKFWGVRGSIPTPLTFSNYKSSLLKILEIAASKDISSHEKRLSFINELSLEKTNLIGGNTTCIQIEYENSMLIFDMGSGIRELGYSLEKKITNKEITELHIFLTHTHYDHISGFPFFLPAYNKDVTINFYSVHKNLLSSLEAHQDFRFFPVSLGNMASNKIFHQLIPDEIIEVNNFQITNKELHHPGKSFAYRIEAGNKSVVLATDAEYINMSIEQIKSYLKFYNQTDLLIFDAQYSFDEEIQKIDWGHSSALYGLDISINAEVKKLALFHHAPDRSDDQICELLNTALIYKKSNYPDSTLEVFLARESAIIEI